MRSQEVKRAGTAEVSKSIHTGEVLHQRRNIPFCPMRMAVVGVLVVSTIGYFTLYTQKKPEASAHEVAKVATSVANANTVHSRK
ncbi:hypothetical protein BVC80_1797g15 [Macleaya cordata]|uniref:Transmembrane protein n=1 Tax=Macleaya cordata TaxID=56857 RepID=A0A200PT21_MACCD|nr:hypothetical protein BVC80_1797g15 [Macleaya cordata]